MKNWFLRLIGRQSPADEGERTDNGIAADAPIRSAAQDCLRRAPYAARIATLLAGPALEEGRVFAIRGGWGHGKSSLKNMVVEQLSVQDTTAKWLDFNPWQWGDGAAISRALFQQIADNLGGRLSTEAGKRAAMFRRYGAILNGAVKPLEQAGEKTQAISLVLTNVSVITVAAALGIMRPSVATIATVVIAAGIGISLVAKLLWAFGRDRWSVPLDDIRRSLEVSLRKLDRPFVVFVDDIDRLEPDQIRLLFRQVKVNANLPNIVFVMLFQPSIVEAALNPIADGQGRAFLEKIVQANFDLPFVPVSMVHAAMTTELGRIADAYATVDNGFEEVHWGNVLVGCIQPFVRNLRDARRYVSSVAIHLPLHAGRTTFEVNIVDFLALEALRVFEPDIHAALFGERDLLLQTIRFGGDRLDDEHTRRVEALVSRAPEARRHVIKVALGELFPRISWVFGGTHYTDGTWDARWIVEKRVCAKRFFPRYFELQTPDGELSESEFNDVIAVSGDGGRLEAAIAELRERGLIPSLAARLDESVGRLPIESAAILLPAMYRVAQSLLPSRETDPFNSPWVSAWRAISWYVRGLPQVDRGPLMREALRQTGALSVAAILIDLNSPQDDKGRDRLEPAIDSATAQTLKNEWLHQLTGLATAGRLLERPDLAYLLFRWRDYTGSADAPKAWVVEAIKTDPGFAAMVTKLMSTGTSQSINDRVASRFDTFDRSTVETFLGLSEARLRLANIERSRLSPEQAQALDVLRRHLDQWSGGENEPVMPDRPVPSSDEDAPVQEDP